MTDLKGPSSALLRGLRLLLRERGTGTMFMALTSALLLLQCLLVLFFSVRESANTFDGSTILRIALQNDADATAVQDLSAALQDLPGIASVRTVSPEELLRERMAENPALKSSIERFKLDNPFGASIDVALTSISAFQPFLALIANERWTQTIDGGFFSAAATQFITVSEKMSTLSLMTTIFGLLLCLHIFAVFCLTCLCIGTRLAHRSDDTRLQCLLGGSLWSIFFPFVFETTILLALGVLCSGAIAALSLTTLPEFAILRLSDMLLTLTLPILFGIELLLCPLLAYAGLMLTIRWQPPSRHPSSF